MYLLLIYVLILYEFFRTKITLTNNKFVLLIKYDITLKINYGFLTKLNRLRYIAY